jgi:uncharacterized protein
LAGLLGSTIDGGFIRQLIAAGVPAGAHNQFGQTVLQCAARTGDQELVHLLMQRGLGKPDLSEMNRVLVQAASSGNPQLVQLLLASGADPLASDGHGKTVLMAAAESGAPEVVNQILRYHPNVNAQDDEHQTAMFMACQRRSYQSDDDQLTKEEQQVQVVRILAKAGANPNLPDRYGTTPLQNAVSEAVIRELINAGAKVDSPQ